MPQARRTRRDTTSSSMFTLLSINADSMNDVRTLEAVSIAKGAYILADA